MIDTTTSRCDVIEISRFGMEDYSRNSLVTRTRSVVPVFVDFVAPTGYRTYLRSGDPAESSQTLCSDGGINGAPRCS